MATSYPLLLVRAKRMRSAMTESEKRVWFHLRAKRLNGFKFYRQVPIGPFIVDFVNYEKNLIVEIDGATHGEAHEVEYDRRRTAFLESRGFRVLRVWSTDVFLSLEWVMDGIVFALEKRK